jgi:hypothetical protein
LLHLGNVALLRDHGFGPGINGGNDENRTIALFEGGKAVLATEVLEHLIRVHAPLREANAGVRHSGGEHDIKAALSRHQAERVLQSRLVDRQILRPQVRGG